MLASTVRTLFRRTVLPPSGAPGSDLVRSIAAREKLGGAATPKRLAQTDWPPARLALAQKLWGFGFIFPGGEEETLRLVRPLGISNGASLLIVGVGGGGPASVVTRNLGSRVTGMESDPALLAAAKGLISRAELEKKVTLKAWDPAKPDFSAESHHHCMAIEPFHGSQPEPILDGLAKVLRPGGQIVITALAAPVPLNVKDPTIRRWGELERRDPAHVLSPVAVTRMLARVGLDLRFTEDISQRHLENALFTWKVMFRELGRKPSRQEAVPMIAEAEMWLLRRRLIRDGRLRMMSWCAITNTPVT